MVHSAVVVALNALAAQIVPVPSLLNDRPVFVALDFFLLTFLLYSPAIKTLTPCLKWSPVKKCHPVIEESEEDVSPATDL